MTQYKNIPQPQDQRNISQGDILNNFQYLLTPLGTTPATNGIIGVDHYATADNVANPSDGFHKQVSLLNITAPTTPLAANAVNGQTADVAIYSFNDGSTTQIGVTNATRRYQLTGNITPSSSIQGSTFLPTSISGTNTIMLWGTLPVNGTTTRSASFSPTFSGVPFNIQVTPFRSSSSSPGTTFVFFIDGSSITNSGFNIINASTHDYGFYWTAIGPK